MSIEFAPEQSYVDVTVRIRVYVDTIPAALSDVARIMLLTNPKGDGTSVPRSEYRAVSACATYFDSVQEML
jgi:hypothetical protein